MKASVKTVIIKQALFLITASFMAFIAALYEKRVIPSEEATIRRLCSDASFVVAVLFLSAGLLLFINHWGGFDSFSYAIAKLRHKTKGSYFDYVKEYHAAKKAPSVLFLTTGVVMLVVAICMGIFSMTI